MPATPRNAKHTYSRHAWNRMNQRRLSHSGVELVREFGRVVYARGAVYCFVGRKEAEAFADLVGVEGVHVLIAHDGTVITAYRNRGFHPSRYRKENYRPAKLRKAARRRRA